MPFPPAAPAPAPDQRPQLSTLWVASCNLLNLALPARAMYPNQQPYSGDEYARKTAWLGQMLQRLNADVLGVQEVWDEAALKATVGLSRLRYQAVVAPGAETGAEGTPRVGLATRLQVDALASEIDFAPAEFVQVPELGEHRRFERPVLHATLRTRGGQRLHVLVAHLKSKRPKFLIDANGQALEDRDDPLIKVRAALRSLVMRGAESAALRGLVLRLIHRTQDPLILLGDMNDGPLSVTSQMIAATDAVVYDRRARDVALFHAYDVQTQPGLKRDMAYSYVHQGMPDTLDQIWVSEELVPSDRGGARAIGDVMRVEYFNDHLHEGRDRSRSDHGFVRALLRLAEPAAQAPRPEAEAEAASGAGAAVPPL